MRQREGVETGIKFVVPNVTETQTQFKFTFEIDFGTRRTRLLSRMTANEVAHTHTHSLTLRVTHNCADNTLHPHTLPPPSRRPLHATFAELASR